MNFVREKKKKMNLLHHDKSIDFLNCQTERCHGRRLHGLRETATVTNENKL